MGDTLVVYSLLVATRLVCHKEMPELEGILLGIRLPLGHVCFNVAALGPGSKAE